MRVARASRGKDGEVVLEDVSVVESLERATDTSRLVRGAAGYGRDVGARGVLERRGALRSETVVGLTQDPRRHLRRVPHPIHACILLVVLRRSSLPLKSHFLRDEMGDWTGDVCKGGCRSFGRDDGKTPAGRNALESMNARPRSTRSIRSPLWAGAPARSTHVMGARCRGAVKGGRTLVSFRGGVWSKLEEFDKKRGDRSKDVRKRSCMRDKRQRRPCAGPRKS